MAFVELAWVLDFSPCWAVIHYEAEAELEFEALWLCPQVLLPQYWTFHYEFSGDIYAK